MRAKANSVSAFRLNNVLNKPEFVLNLYDIEKVSCFCFLLYRFPSFSSSIAKHQFSSKFLNAVWLFGLLWFSLALFLPKSCLNMFGNDFFGNPILYSIWIIACTKRVWTFLNGSSSNCSLIWMVGLTLCRWCYEDFYVLFTNLYTKKMHFFQLQYCLVWISTSLFTTNCIILFLKRKLSFSDWKFCYCWFWFGYGYHKNYMGN